MLFSPAGYNAAKGCPLKAASHNAVIIQNSARRIRGTSRQFAARTEARSPKLVRNGIIAIALLAGAGISHFYPELFSFGGAGERPEAPAGHASGKKL